MTDIEPAAVPTTAEDRVRALGDSYGYVDIHQGGKRCGVRWAPFMGDWFTSWSPRNDNSNAEGFWDHWIDLALEILRDPLTAKVRPDAHAAVAGVQPMDLYDGANVQLTYEDLAERFKTEVDAANGGAA